MLTYQYLSDDWQFVAIDNLEDGFAKLNNRCPTIFFFDDFLGRIALNKQALTQRDAAFSTFIKQVRRMKNIRFVLTTRAHIFEEARIMSDYVDDKKLQLSKYLLNVDIYTRKVKSLILFNHLFASSLSNAKIRALLKRDWLVKIVDHPNYNPRIIASISNGSINLPPADQYPDFVMRSLDEPDLIWDKPYSMLDMRSQNLLIVLFFFSDFGAFIDDLQDTFIDFHKVISRYYSRPTNPKDFNNALKSLEGGFVAIIDKKVNYINPSLRDYLSNYLTEFEFLKLLPGVSQRVDWARSLWIHTSRVLGDGTGTLIDFANEYSKYMSRIQKYPTFRKTNRDGSSLMIDDLSQTERMDFVLDLWRYTKNPIFKQTILLLASTDKLGLVPWRDGVGCIKLIGTMKHELDNEFKNGDVVITSLSEKLIGMINGLLSIDDLISIVENFNEHLDINLYDNIQNAIDKAVNMELDGTYNIVDELDTEEELEGYAQQILELSALTNNNAIQALENIGERTVEVRNNAHERITPTYKRKKHRKNGDQFDNKALYNLFNTLRK